MRNRQKQCGGRACNRRKGQTLDPALLLLLKQAPAHGYTLLNRLAEFGLDFLAPTVIYRALREMETKDWVTSTWDAEETQGPPRRIYALTDRGCEILSCCVAQLHDTQQIVEYILALHDELTPPDDPSALTGGTQPDTKEPAMKVVIPANGDTLDASVSTVFGRCQTFILVDPQTMDFEALPNPALDAPGGAGVQAAQTVIQRGAQVVIAPHLGPNAFRVFDAAGIPAYQLQGATVRDVVTAYQAGQLPKMGVPSAQHRGLGRGRRRGQRE